MQQRLLSWFDGQGPMPCGTIKPHQDFPFLIDDAQIPNRYPKISSRAPFKKGSNYFRHAPPLRIDRVITRIAEVAYDRTHRLKNPNKPWECTLEDHKPWTYKKQHRRYSIDAITTDDNKLFEPRGIPRPTLPGGGKVKYTRRSVPSDEMLKKHIPASTESTFFETGNGQLTSGDYHIITQSGGSGRFEDNHIGMGFDMLERILSCATHRIALSNVSYASHMLDIAHLASSKSENPELYDSLHDLQIDANAINKFTDKDFIVFPINDAYPRTLRQDIPWSPRLYDLFRPQENEGTGSHWSVMLVDCRGPSLKGHYLDSLHNSANATSISQVIGEMILQGLQILLNNESYRYSDVEFIVDPHAPSQSLHNQSRKTDGGSACGPFVYLMAKEICQFVVECGEEGREVPRDLSLPAGFAERLRWDSSLTRQSFGNLVDREVRERKRLNDLRVCWFDDGWKGWLEERGLPVTWTWDPYEYMCRA
jgi:hypothetical protein